MNMKLWKDSGLKNGRLSNLNYDEARRALVLAGPLEGVYLSEEFETEDPFNDLVASWNALTPGKTQAEVYARLRVNGRWSAWMSWGVWGAHIERNCPDQEDDLVWANSYRDGGDSSVNVKDGKTADAFQLKAVLRAGAEEPRMPVLTLLAATWKNTNDPDWQEKSENPDSRGRAADRTGRCLCPGPPCFRRKRDFRSGRQKICGEACPARQKEVRPAVYARSPGGSPASAAGGQSLPHFRTSTAAAGYRRTAAGPAG